jgi:uncharacterized protein YaiE (UPF0345 family)
MFTMDQYFAGKVASIAFAGEQLPATVKFQLQVATDTAYLCTYA